jgi:hypothetical protein
MGLTDRTDRPGLTGLTDRTDRLDHWNLSVLTDHLTDRSARTNLTAR